MGDTRNNLTMTLDSTRLIRYTDWCFLLYIEEGIIYA